MRRLVFEPRFERDAKRLKRRGEDIEQLLVIARLLVQHGRLTDRFRPHKLSGEYDGLWECHAGFDCVLIYEIDEHEVRLIRTGSHDDLF